MPCQPSERPGQSLVGLSCLFRSGVPRFKGSETPHNMVSEIPPYPQFHSKLYPQQGGHFQTRGKQPMNPHLLSRQTHSRQLSGYNGSFGCGYESNSHKPKTHGLPRPGCFHSLLGLSRPGKRVRPGTPKDPVDLDLTTLPKPRKGSRSIAGCRSGHPTKTNRVERASGRQAPKVHSELRTYHLTPLDSEHSPRVQDRVSAASPKSTLQSSAFLSSRAPLHLGGIESPAITGSNSPSTSGAMGRLFPLQPLPGTKERWGNEASDQFEEPQCVCGSGIFLNGGATSSELPNLVRGLVHKSGSEGRLLSCPNSPQPTEIPQVHVGGDTVPVQ